MSRCRKGFTLIELLVAMAIMVLMSSILVQAIQSTSQVWSVGQGRINSSVKARAMLDMFARDIQKGVFQSNLGAFPEGSNAFYTEEPGISTNTNAPLRNVSLVSYNLEVTATNAILQRGDMPISWSDSNPISFGGSNSLPDLGGVTARDTAQGVVAFRVLFISASGQISTNYDTANPPKALAVGVAVVDDNSLQTLSSQDKLSNLSSSLQAGITGTNSMKADLEHYLNTDFNWTGYPGSLRTGLQVFERYVALP
jgi:prepilin-type N-terminal cleavage/methylation domain-containing protein